MPNLDMTFTDGTSISLSVDQLEGVEFKQCDGSLLWQSIPLDEVLLLIYDRDPKYMSPVYYIQNHPRCRIHGDTFIGYVERGYLEYVSYVPPAFISPDHDLLAQEQTTDDLAAPVKVDTDEVERKRQSDFFFKRSWTSGVR